MTPIKTVWVFGVGGVGGYFGSAIARATGNMEKNGHEVYFIARGNHLKAIQANGLTLVASGQTTTATPAAATDTVDNLPHPDMVLLCVKSYDLEKALSSMRPKINHDTMILPLLNGVDIYDRVKTTLPTGSVLPACVYVGTHIDRPGVIHANGGDGRILWGRDPGRSGGRPESVMHFFERVGIHHQYADDPFPAIWEKYIFIAAFGLTTAYFDKPIGEVWRDPESNALTESIMEEISLLAKAKNVRMKKSIIAESIEKANRFPVHTKTSYQRDIERKGGINEGDLFGETIIRQGRQLGIATPVTEQVTARIQRRIAEREKHGKNDC